MAFFIISNRNGCERLWTFFCQYHPSNLPPPPPTLKRTRWNYEKGRISTNCRVNICSTIVKTNIRRMGFFIRNTNIFVRWSYLTFEKIWPAILAALGRHFPSRIYLQTLGYIVKIRPDLLCIFVSAFCWPRGLRIYGFDTLEEFSND